MITARGASAASGRPDRPLSAGANPALRGPHLRLDGSPATWPALALGYLTLFGSLLAYSCYEWLIRHALSALVGTYAFVNPVVAVLLGWWLLAEPISARTLLAAAVIVAGVALTVTPRRQNRARLHAEQAEKSTQKQSSAAGEPALARLPLLPASGGAR